MATRSWGLESRVNTSFLDAHDRARIATLSDGGFVVVWLRSGGPGSVVLAQIHTPLGVAVSGEITVASTTSGPPLAEPTVAALSDGRFYVAWTDPVGAIRGALYQGASVQRTDTVSVPVGHEAAALAALPAGPAVAWGVGGEVELRLLDAVGAGPLIPITPGAAPGSRPAVATSPDGARLALAWQDQGGLQLQLFTAAGTAATDAVAVVATPSAARPAAHSWPGSATAPWPWPGRRGRPASRMSAAISCCASTPPTSRARC